MLKSKRTVIVRKIIKYTGIFLLAALLLLLCYNFFGGAICNDVKASRIEKTYAAMKLPEKTELIETASYVGNTSGTGNHTEIWAGALIFSQLSETEITAFFSEYHVYDVVDEREIADAQETFLFSYGRYSDLFPALKTSDSETGYYIIYDYYDAFTQADLRGH